MLIFFSEDNTTKQTLTTGVVFRNWFLDSIFFSDNNCANFNLSYSRTNVVPLLPILALEMLGFDSVEWNIIFSFFFFLSFANGLLIFIQFRYHNVIFTEGLLFASQELNFLFGCLNNVHQSPRFWFSQFFFAYWFCFVFIKSAHLTHTLIKTHCVSSINLVTREGTDSSFYCCWCGTVYTINHKKLFFLIYGVYSSPIYLTISSLQTLSIHLSFVKK